ncbi:MAG: hypothetical protein ACRDL6_11350 [Solirubrobacterales bacterium]
MRVRISPNKLCLVGALALALAPATPALGAPAGDEYLPSVPKADGKESPAKGNGGSGSAAGAPAPQDTGAPPADSGGEGSGKDSGKDKAQKVAKAGAAPIIPVDQTSSSDDSSGALDTLLDPVVLLLLAGVAITAIGMTMRRRQAVAGDAGGERATRELGSAPPTPDGEIIGREPPA